MSSVRFIEFSYFPHHFLPLKLRIELHATEDHSGRYAICADFCGWNKSLQRIGIWWLSRSLTTRIFQNWFVRVYRQQWNWRNDWYVCSRKHNWRLQNSFHFFVVYIFRCFVSHILSLLKMWAPVRFFFVVFVRVCLSRCLFFVLQRRFYHIFDRTAFYCMCVCERVNVCWYVVEIVTKQPDEWE